MITILSPAKTLDFDSITTYERSSSPRFEEDGEKLVTDLKKLSTDDLENLMGISESLAKLNYDRYQTWEDQPFRQAIMTFNGHVYRDIDWENYTPNDFDYAQDHVRILSGLYGLIRPLDFIKPYRLEMGTNFSIDDHHNLYEFWGDKIAEALNEDLALQGDSNVINLASNEYAKAVLRPSLQATVITPIFRDWNEKSSTYRIISVYAKLARGTMTNWIIQNKVDSLDDLKSFSEDNYYFKDMNEKSDKKTGLKKIELIFLRD